MTRKFFLFTVKKSVTERNRLRHESDRNPRLMYSRYNKAHYPMETTYRIKLPLAGLQIAIKRLLVGATQAVIAMRHRSASRVSEWIALPGDWLIADRPINFTEYHAFAQLAVLSTSRTPVALPQIGSGQVVAVLTLDLDQPDSIAAKIIKYGIEQPVEELVIVGAGMIRMGNSFSGVDRLEDPQRNSRLMQVQGDAAPTWRNSKLIVIGAGTGGSELNRQLASQSPKGLVLVDPDSVQRHNLNNLPHVKHTDTRKRRSKVECLAKSLNRNHPELLIQGLRHRVQDPIAWSFLCNQHATAVFSFVDDESATIAASILSRELEIPHIAVGTLISRDSNGRLVQQADVRLLEPHRGCARCVPWMPEREWEETFYELHRPADAFRRGVPRLWDDGGRVGSTLSLNAIAAGLAVELFARYLRGTVTTSTWIRYMSSEGKQPQLLESAVGPDERCTFCTFK